MNDTASIRFHNLLETIGFGRPAGKGVRHDYSAWECLYPFFPLSNEEYAQPFTDCGVPFTSDGIIRDSKPSMKTLNGRGYAFDFILNPRKPVICEMKLGRKLFNGNEAIDLSTGTKQYINAIEWSIINNTVLTLNVYEHRLPNGNIGLFCEAINLSLLLEAYEDEQFDHKVIYRKVSKRGKYTYTTLRIKPSAIVTWRGRREQNKSVRAILKDMGILTEPIYLASFDGVQDKVAITSREFASQLETIY